MSAATPLAFPPALADIDTPTLVSMQSQLEQRMATLKGYALDRAEDEYDDISTELEHRLIHIVIDGETTRLKFEWCGGECLCYDADNYDLGFPMGAGKDAWEARNELEEIMGCRADRSAGRSAQ